MSLNLPPSLNRDDTTFERRLRAKTHDANEGDFILISNATDVTQNIHDLWVPWQPHRLFVVTNIYRPSRSDSPLSMLVKDLTYFWPAALDNFRAEPCPRKDWKTPNVAIQDVLTTNSTIVLRPNTQLVHSVVTSVACPYESCEYGLVPLTAEYAHERGLGREWGEIGAPCALCEFCMGAAIFHEYEAYYSVLNGKTPEQQLQDHLRAINVQRRNLDYEAFPDTAVIIRVGLAWLLSMSLRKSPLEPRYAFDVYPAAHFMEYEDWDPDYQCGICLEGAEATERLMKLSCGHFFHEECLKPWQQISWPSRCPYRCVGATKRVLVLVRP